MDGAVPLLYHGVGWVVLANKVILAQSHLLIVVCGLTTQHEPYNLACMSFYASKRATTAITGTLGGKSSVGS